MAKETALIPANQLLNAQKKASKQHILSIFETENLKFVKKNSRFRIAALIPVYAGCYCTVDSRAELQGPVGVNKEGKPNPYAPERVNLRSNHEFYKDWLLIYGHLMNIQVSPGQSVTPDTIIGYLETTEIHVHVEIRKPDNSYINPFPYLSPDLQAQMYSFQGGGVGTTYRPGFSSDPYNQKPGGY